MVARLIILFVARELHDGCQTELSGNWFHPRARLNAAVAADHHPACNRQFKAVLFALRRAFDARCRLHFGGSHDRSLWNRMTAEELRQKAVDDAIVLLPVASTEQHGPHLATGVDAFLGSEDASARLRSLLAIGQSWSRPWCGWDLRSTMWPSAGPFRSHSRRIIAS